jgi:hypothetical protein
MRVRIQVCKDDRIDHENESVRGGMSFPVRFSDDAETCQRDIEHMRDRIKNFIDTLFMSATAFELEVHKDEGSEELWEQTYKKLSALQGNHVA